MRPLNYVAAVVGLACCLNPTAAQTIVDGSGSGIASGDIAALRQAFAVQLADPLSAQLRKVAHPFAGTRFERHDIVCGFVNAKNTLGAYVGFRAFTFGGHRNDVTIYDPERAETLRLAFNFSDCPWSE